MKPLQLLFLSLSILLLTQCSKDSSEDTITTTLCENDAMVEFIIVTEDEITIDFPDCFTHTPLQGIDSYVGKIEAPEQNVKIDYDIGLFTGSYVSESSAGQVTIQGDSETFRYEVQEGMLIFTFPDAGPANFITSQVEYQEDLIEFFKTLAVN